MSSKSDGLMDKWMQKSLFVAVKYYGFQSRKLFDWEDITGRVTVLLFLVVLHSGFSFEYGSVLHCLSDKHSRIQVLMKCLWFLIQKFCRKGSWRYSICQAEQVSKMSERKWKVSNGEVKTLIWRNISLPFNSGKSLPGKLARFWHFVSSKIIRKRKSISIKIVQGIWPIRNMKSIVDL